MLLRDTSASPPASASRTPSLSSASTQPTRVPPPSALSGGARATTARVGSSSYADAVVPLLTDRDACTSSTRFVLDARYSDAHFVIGPTTPQASVTTTATVRLDGRAREIVTLGADERKAIRLDVTGVRTMTVDLHSTSCSPNDETPPVALVDDVLTTR